MDHKVWGVSRECAITNRGWTVESGGVSRALWLNMNPTQFFLPNGLFCFNHH